jgi:hypothetical protein
MLFRPLKRMKQKVLAPLWDEPAAYQLVGRVTAYQGYDG